MHRTWIGRPVRRALVTSTAIVAGCGLLAGFAPEAGAQSISVDFYGGGGGGSTGVSTQMAPTETAGFVPLANWNSFTGASQGTSQPLVDQTGAVSGATINWTSNNTWNTGAAAGTGNLKMMKGYLDSSDTSITQVNVSNLPASLAAAPFAVVMYYDGDNAGNNRVGKYWVTAGPAGAATYWGRDAANSTFTGTFIQGQSGADPLAGGGAIDNNAAAALTVPAGNMVIFRGLIGPGFTLWAQSSVASDATNRSAIQGFQIVPDALVPEPGAATLLGIAAAGLLARRRRAK